MWCDLPEYNEENYMLTPFDLQIKQQRKSLLANIEVKPLDDDDFGDFSMTTFKGNKKPDLCKFIKLATMRQDQMPLNLLLQKLQGDIELFKGLTVFDIKRAFEQAVKSIWGLSEDLEQLKQVIKKTKTNTESINTFQGLRARLAKVEMELEINKKEGSLQLNNLCKQCIAAQDPIAFLQNFIVQHVKHLPNKQQFQAKMNLIRSMSHVSQWRLTQNAINDLKTYSSDVAEWIEDEKILVQKAILESKQYLLECEIKVEEEALKVYTESINLKESFADFFSEDDVFKALREADNYVKKYVRLAGKWWGFKRNKELIILLILSGGTIDMLSKDQDSCSEDDYWEILKVVDIMCMYTKSQQAKISHIIYGKKFKGLTKERKSAKAVMDATFPRKYFEDDFKQAAQCFKTIGSARIFKESYWLEGKYNNEIDSEYIDIIKTEKYKELFNSKFETINYKRELFLKNVEEKQKIERSGSTVKALKKVKFKKSDQDLKDLREALELQKQLEEKYQHRTKNMSELDKIQVLLIEREYKAQEYKRICDEKAAEKKKYDDNWRERQELEYKLQEEEEEREEKEKERKKELERQKQFDEEKKRKDAEAELLRLEAELNDNIDFDEDLMKPDSPIRLRKKKKDKK